MAKRGESLNLRVILFVQSSIHLSNRVNRVNKDSKTTHLSHCFRLNSGPISVEFGTSSGRVGVLAVNI